MSQLDGAQPTAQQVPAGWYPDHTGEPRMRWWDGQQWTEHVSQPAPAAAAVIPRNTVPATTPVTNVFIWLIVLMPLLTYTASTLLLLTFNWGGLLSSELTNPAASLAIYANPLFALTELLGFAIYGLTALFAYFDWKRLSRDGFVRPFHWAWSFLGGLVYVIGRTVVARRRSGRGMAPMWVLIAVFVVGFIATGIGEAALFAAIAHNLPSYGTTGLNA